MKLLVLVPSRLKRAQAGELFLARALQSVAGQKIPPALQVDVEIAIGVDPGSVLPTDLTLPPNAKVVEAAVASQAFALNAAAAGFDHDFLAILEDDDLWGPAHLHLSLTVLRQKALDFVSSTQLLVDESGKALAIADFPTPSGWVMRRGVWETVGRFDTSFRYHLDSDWLGRLSVGEVPRGHLVEVSAVMRPGLQDFMKLAGPHASLVRHANPIPFVVRMIHAGSGMASLETDPIAKATSERERERLVAAFGRMPW
jgi:hypothetical protein